MVFKGWKKKKMDLKIDSTNVRVDAISPEVISASRSTDIPAFYSDWLINRLQEGYVVWTNPINQIPQVVNLDNVKMIIFWTKNADPIIKHLETLDNMGIRYYFQYTVNDYENEGFEPNLPSLDHRIKTFQNLSELIGKEKVVWRFDPLLLSSQLNVASLVEKITNVGDRLYGFTNRLVFSFIDINIYSLVKRNLKNAGLSDVRELSVEEMNEIASILQNINKKWQLSIATCGEVIDLTKYGIIKNKCVDPNIIELVCSDNQEFVQCIKKIATKDLGQRNECGCMPSKDIGQYNTCMHRCVYCYANHYQSKVEQNYFDHLKNPNSPTINGSSSWLKYYEKKNDSQTKLEFF